MSLPRAFQWLGVAAALFVLVGLNWDFESEAGKTMNAPVEDSLSQSLLGYWKMDEGTGTSTTADSSGNSNNLTMTNADAEDWQTGQIGGYSLDFNGTDEWLTVADPASGILDFGNGASFSITGWFNRDTENTVDTIVAKRNGTANTDDGYLVYIGTDDLLYFEASEISGTDERQVVSTSTFATTGWHHFAVSWQEGSDVSLFIDGASQGTASGSTFANVESLATALDFRIGAESDNGNPFDGKIDDVKLYSHALSANEVSRLYQTTVPGSPVDTGLVGHWTFDGNDVTWGDTSNEIKDVSGKGNHGNALGSLATTSVTPGKLGQGLSFNGTSDYVSMAYSDSLDIIGEESLTIAGWFNLDSMPGNQYSGTTYWIFGRGEDGVAHNYAFIIASDAFTLYPSMASFDLVPSVNSWFHLAVVFNDPGNTVTGYHNGSSLGTDGVSESWNDSYSGLTYVGRKPPGITAQGGTYFDGRMDDLRIYDRALSSSEITNLYNLGK